MVLTGQNVLVTGGTGFIGSHLVKRLVAQHCNVIVSCQSLNPKSYFSQQGLDRFVTLANLNVKDFKRTREVITKYEIDTIFHLAAQATVTSSYYNPLETIETNVVGTANVLEAARLWGQCKSILVCSSDKAYGKLPRVNEKKPLSGTHPYETSKAAEDLIASTYHHTYKLPVVITRFGNVYGEGDLNMNRIIPGILKAVILQEELILRSNGKYTRDYVYVDDIVDAMILLVKNPGKTVGEAFNVSSLENLSVLELISRVEMILKTKIKYKINNTALNEIPHQSVDFKKIKTMLGWKPKNNLKTVITDIFAWYHDYFKLQNFHSN